MSARHLATFCLLSLGWAQARAESPSAGALELFVKTSSLPSHIRSEMKHLVETTMRQAGFHVDWFESSGVPDTTGHLVVVEFRGNCVPSSFGAVGSAESFARLAYSAVSDGRVLPFTWVDCEQVSRVLSKSGAAHSQRRQDRDYARALARVLSHELYHVLAQTTAHTARGLSKARVRANELTADSFGFGPVAIEQLHAAQIKAPDSANTLVRAGL